MRAALLASLPESTACDLLAERTLRVLSPCELGQTKPRCDCCGDSRYELRCGISALAHMCDLLADADPVDPQSVSADGRSMPRSDCFG